MPSLSFWTSSIYIPHLFPASFSSFPPNYLRCISLIEYHLLGFSAVMWSIPLISASLCLLNICFFPQVFPQTKLTTLFLSFLTLNTFIWAIYKVFIYPFWFSPLRHLPRPKVRSIPFLREVMQEFWRVFLTYLVFWYPNTWTWQCAVQKTSRKCVPQIHDWSP